MTAPVLSRDEHAELTEDELFGITRYVQPKRQLEILHKRGFVMAEIVRGRVSLPREHYKAVCRGVYGKAQPEETVLQPDFSMVR